MKILNQKTFRIKAKVAQDRGLMRKVLKIMAKRNVIKINCPYCGKEIITTKTRLVRLENEDKAFQCKKCNMNFKIKSNFKGRKLEDEN